MITTPVLIAARNEADCIGNALGALTEQAEPIVIANGCNDRTAEIAKAYGATVIECDEEGKTSALQAGIKHLGNRAVEPFVTLDADSKPVFPRNWLNSLLHTRETLPPDEPAVVVGAIIFKGGTSSVAALARTIRSTQLHVATRNDTHGVGFSGANMLIDPKTGDVVDEILELPQIWPGVDWVIKDIILSNGGNVRKSIRPGAMIFSDSGRYPGFTRRLLEGRQTGEARGQLYLSDAPPDAITGTQYKELKAGALVNV